MIESVNTEKTIIEGKITNTETFETIGETTNVDSTKTKEELTTYKLSTLGLFVNILKKVDVNSFLKRAGIPAMELLEANQSEWLKPGTFVNVK